MEKVYRAIIIDDEEPARTLVRHYLEKHSSIEITGEFPDGFSGLKGIHEQKPDLVFLDIQMPRLTGFELLELLEDGPAIIFTTAYDQYAIKAFERNAVDYLLKPFTRDRFDESVARAIARLTDKKPRQGMADLVTTTHTGEHIQRIITRKGSSIKILPVPDVHYFEAMDDYVRIYTGDEKFMKKMTMKRLENGLDSESFVRIHRSYIVAINSIQQMELYQKDQYLAILKSGERLPVSKSGLARLKARLDF
jgi:two-component system LytT family response regulator